MRLSELNNIFYSGYKAELGVTNDIIEQKFLLEEINKETERMYKR